jgi:hypothetical protein
MIPQIKKRYGKLIKHHHSKWIREELESQKAIAAFKVQLQSISDRRNNEESSRIYDKITIMETDRVKFIQYYTVFLIFFSG